MTSIAIIIIYDIHDSLEKKEGELYLSPHPYKFPATNVYSYRTPASASGRRNQEGGGGGLVEQRDQKGDSVKGKE